MKQYDYIFAGTGLASLMTVYELLQRDYFKSHRILLLDSEIKNSNDRTWCFWDQADTFSEIAAHNWDSIRFTNSKFTREMALTPFQYRQLRSRDFYAFVFDFISQHSQVDVVQEKVISITEKDAGAIVQTLANQYEGNLVFNSILDWKKLQQQPKYPLLQQHFVGWFIQSKEAVFNPDVATFMDFAVEQKGNTRFMYVLPTSANEALLEYTLFSKDLLPKEEYEAEIQKHIQKLGISAYEIVEREQGSIPMTCFPFWKANTKHFISIGSAGGWTKASTGFTFKNTTKKAKHLVDYLEHKTTKPFQFNRKFWFYDLLLLDILHDDNAQGSRIFSGIFSSAKPQLILRFLDEETSIWEDLQLIWHCPKRLFIRALFKRVLSGF
jgi:lycopene beta-cyclase